MILSKIQEHEITPHTLVSCVDDKNIPAVRLVNFEKNLLSFIILGSQAAIALDKSILLKYYIVCITVFVCTE